jgi:hypothetical protein
LVHVPLTGLDAAGARDAAARRTLAQIHYGGRLDLLPLP